MWSTCCNWWMPHWTCQYIGSLGRHFVRHWWGLYDESLMIWWLMTWYEALQFWRSDGMRKGVFFWPLVVLFKIQGTPKTYGALVVVITMHNYNFQTLKWRETYDFKKVKEASGLRKRFIQLCPKTATAEVRGIQNVKKANKMIDKMTIFLSHKINLFIVYFEFSNSHFKEEKNSYYFGCKRFHMTSSHVWIFKWLKTNIVQLSMILGNFRHLLSKVDFQT